MQNGDFWTRTTSLYGSQPSPGAFERKTATFGLELQISTGTRPHQSFCACSTACLASELVSMGPRPHLWILNAKQRLLVQNYMSLWVPDLTICFMDAKQRK